jgi:hypothetical protein
LSGDSLWGHVAPGVPIANPQNVLVHAVCGRDVGVVEPSQSPGLDLEAP